MRAMAGLALMIAPFAVGCAVKPTYLNRDLHTVAVLPPFNSTGFLEASTKMWSHVEHQVALRGYGCISRETVRAFYEKNKYALPEEINQYTAEQLAKAFGVEGIVYSNLTKWDRVTLLIYTKLTVALEAEIRDGKTGETLWRGEGDAGESEGGRDAVASSVGAAIAGLGALERYCGPAAADCFSRMPRPGFEPKK